MAECFSSRASNQSPVRHPDCLPTAPKTDPQTVPRTSLEIPPQIAAQPTVQSVLRPPPKPRSQGPKMPLESEPAVERLKKSLATMWPHLCPESGPSFSLGFCKYVKIPYLEVILGVEARAALWPRVWPHSGHIYI